MIAILKGLVAGTIATIIIAMLVDRTTGSSGGALGIHVVQFNDYYIYWSWLLFVVLAGFSAALFKMME